MRYCTQFHSEIPCLYTQEMKNAAYSLFPGQIILVYGTNSSGQKMLAQRIIEGVAAPLPTSSPERLLELHHGSSYQGGMYHRSNVHTRQFIFRHLVFALRNLYSVILSLCVRESILLTHRICMTGRTRGCLKS